MKFNVSKVGMVLVCTAALSAVVVNQVAQAQQRTQFAPITIFKSSRIASSDAGFRYAAAAVLSPVRQSVINKSQGADEVTVFFSSIAKDFFSETAVKKRVGDTSANNMSRFTPGQLAIAETLFTETNLSGAKNLAVTPEGITGSISPQEAKLSATKLKELTVQRLQLEVKNASAAVSELQQ